VEKEGRMAVAGGTGEMRLIIEAGISIFGSAVLRSTFEEFNYKKK
jgi:hypothetical protein